MQAVQSLRAPHDEPFPYTPVWLATTTNPTMGDGAITGAWTRSGRLVFVTIGILIGSTTNVGTGNYSITLPFNAAKWPYPNGQSSEMFYCGKGWAVKWTVAFYDFVARITPGSNLMAAYFHNSANAWTSAFPVTFVNGNIIEFELCYPTDVLP